MVTVTRVAIGLKSSGKVAWLAPGPAASWDRMLAAGCPAGEITDAGRTYAEQVELFTSRYTTSYARSAKRDRRLWQGRTYWRLPGVASAATPGESNHETGTALDLAGATLAWVRAHGAPFGWICDLVPAEPWHVTFLASSVRVHVPDPVAVPPLPATPRTIDTPEELEMTSFITEALTDAYITECGRDPDPEGLRFRRLRIATGTSTLRSEIADIDVSTESNRWAVHGLYLKLLGRDGSVPEWDGWIARVDAGDVDQKLDRLTALIAASPEAHAFAAKKG